MDPFSAAPRKWAVLCENAKLFFETILCPTDDTAWVGIELSSPSELNRWLSPPAYPPVHITTWSNILDFYARVYDRGDGWRIFRAARHSSPFPIDMSWDTIRETADPSATGRWQRAPQWQGISKGPCTCKRCRRRIGVPLLFTLCWLYLYGWWSQQARQSRAVEKHASLACDSQTCKRSLIFWSRSKIKIIGGEDQDHS